jgi:arylsulfatase
LWELYHVAEDFSQATISPRRDRRSSSEMQDLFMKEAARNHVLPIDDRPLGALRPVGRRAPRPDGFREPR